MKQLKFIVSICALAFLVLSVSNCGSSTTNTAIVFEKNPPFIISEVYAQDWVAGVQGGGSGTNLFVTFSSINEDVEMKQLFFRNKIEDTKTKPNVPLQITGYFKGKNNERVIMDSNPVKEAQNTPPAAFPFQLSDTEAVLSYTISGALYYYKISDIENREAIAYPSSNKPTRD
ncbi:hypothetical protein [Ulvibacter litoralis]|uniref:Lipoprotein n=1 Tax=Ulvibacter litoralis TaxID=227084 RepID=A0A1G7D8F1_9FLAO|nr:hypothetical protein [Ulvibacter litoralis]GHC44711.1 hypothetical protein GCM10008083_04130 [Ulvibacter litoralis]SDE47045.1 hypothetical protein SAMN05421855_101793 [Ulvibacter litoralis]